MELADGLIERGHKVTVTHMGVPSYYRWYGKPKCKIRNYNPNVLLRAFRKYVLKGKGMDYNLGTLLARFIPECDINVATACFTALPTFLSQKGEMVYLIQHYEPLFYSDPVLRAEAEFSYGLPLLKLCVSNWLTKEVDGLYLGNGINLKKFKPLPLKRTYDVMVLLRSISWKGNYTPVVEELRKKGYKVLVVSDVSETQLLEGYNISKTFLYLSSMREGFGLPPLEAMRCGAIPIMTPCTEYCIHSDNSLLLLPEEPIVEQVDGYLTDLENGRYYKNLVKGASETAEDFDFKDIVDRFENLIQ